MAKHNKKQQTPKAEVVDLNTEKNKPRYCDHQWSFVSKDETKDTIDWRCNRCNDVGFTRGPIPKGNWEDKLVGF